METNCRPNCDSILKKAKWLIIAETCGNLIHPLGILILAYILNNTKNSFLYLTYITSVFNLILYLLILIAYLYLRKYPNKALKRTANILLFTLAAEIISNIIHGIFHNAQQINLISGIILVYFYFMAYGNLLKDKVIRKIYISPIYLLCVGMIILNFGSIYLSIFTLTTNTSTWEINNPFLQVNSIVGYILDFARYILIICGWKQLLSTPSQIPTTTSDTPISLKPSKIEYGYIVSCGVLIALLFIYFNSVSLDIFTK